MTPTDHIYANLLASINDTGELVPSRNGPARRQVFLDGNFTRRIWDPTQER